MEFRVILLNGKHWTSYSEFSPNNVPLFFSQYKILGTIMANCTRIQNIANTHFNPHLVLYKLQV